MIAKIDIFDEQQAQQLLTIQRAAYTIEARLIGSSAIPALTEEIADLQQNQEIFEGYWLEKRLVGAISYKVVDGTLDIYRLVVDPAYFRRGIGRKLVERAEEIARESCTIHTMIVSTGTKNVPARDLYRRLDFTAIQDQEIVPGLMITHFEKKVS